MKKVMMMAYCLLLSVAGVMAETPEVVATAKMNAATDWSGAEKVTLTEIDRMSYYDDDSDLWIYMHGQRVADKVKMDFNFDIIAPKSGLENDKVYQWDEMLHGMEPASDDFCFAVVDGAYYQYEDADFSMTSAKDGMVLGILAHVAFDGKKYELRYDAPTPKDTVEMAFGDGRIYQYKAEGQTRYDGWDSKKEYNLSIMLKSTEEEGTYQWSDINQTFTYMKQFLPAPEGEETGDVNEFVFYSAKVTLKKTEGGCQLDAYMSCTDGHCYHCLLDCPMPKVEKQVTIEANELYYHADSRETEGFGYFSGYQGEEYCVNLAIFPHKGEGMTGHYTETDLEAMYSMVMDAAVEEKYEIYKAEIDVVRDSIGGWKVSGTALCYNNTEYTFRMQCAGEYEFDEESNDLDVHFMNKEVMMMDEYLESNGVLSLIAARKNKFATLIEFHVDFEKDMRAEFEKTGEYHLPAGSYKIDDSGQVGTVSSSFGLVNGEPNPSWASHLMGEDQIDAPFWFMVSGEVKVSYEDGKQKVEVTALNSFGKKIHVLIDDDPQGVGEVRNEKEEVRKEMREGRVVIVSGESVYGLMGSKLLDEGQRP